jgi:hypothetical protein
MSSIRELDAVLGGVMQVLKQNQYLRHDQYGRGVVTESNAQRTTIDFELHGVKKFVTDLMQCELLTGQAPARAAAKQSRKAASSRSKAAARKA